MSIAYQSTGPKLAEPLTADEIELINAHGPYNQSVWRGRGITITHEEGLAGRIEFLSATLRSALKKQFSDEQLSRMSIIDIGCCDGWLLESLSDLPFARMVGVEPRRENIERGKRVREILRIPSRVCYRLGEIENINEGTFDIVLCMGVLHHLESIATGLQKLRSICRRMLILETLCLPSRHLTPELRQDAEMKDVVYRYMPHVFGITLQRFEGGYYPGSGIKLGVVNVPTAESLRMHLDMLGFLEVNVLADWESYRQAIPHNHRPINATCVSALVDVDQSTDKESTHGEWLIDYETRMTTVVLPKELIVPLHAAVCVGETTGPLSGRIREIVNTLKQSEKNLGAMNCLANQLVIDPTQREILAAFPHSPEDKIRFEYAKHLFVEGNVELAKSQLQQISRKPNADWRACYRAFYLLWRVSVLQQDDPTAERFHQYCLTCNPRFPRCLFDSPPALRAC